MQPTDFSKITFLSLAKAARLIQNGEIIGYPTDTIYGLGTNPFNHMAVEEIFRIKQREPGQQIILLVDKNYDLSVIVEEVNSTAKKLMQNFGQVHLPLSLKIKQVFLHL
ncbi:MAG: Sua5/YciO/YrdC/YwlC family protein [Clostridia bacterium]|nr:Sua5/YciO/YrdC/YwlC family protein [Clostridia bacterium]